MPTLDTLFRQIFQRIRRNWIAFRFQVNRYTLGLFRRQTALKLGGLVLAGYWLLFTDRELWIFSLNPMSESSGAIAMETGYDMPVEPVAGHGQEPEEYEKKPAGKSLNWGKTNEAAPLSIYELRDEQSQAYINRFSKIAILEMKKFGIPASISLAQGLVESRSGTSKLASRNNNHFGIKCFSKKCKTGHCTNFSDDTHKDFFRKFTNPWESWRAHSLILAKGRYARLKQYGRNYRKWAQGLEQSGYATDRTYAEKLIGVIEKYNLQRFDK